MAPRTETHDRILQKADELFSRFGCSKTAVTDIARDLNMSPANVYKFFPSKRALIEAVGATRLLKLRGQLLAVTNSRKTAWHRIEDLVHAVAEFFHTHIVEDEDLLEIEAMRRETNFAFVNEFHEFLRNEIAKLIRQGIDAGEMTTQDPGEAAAALLDCLTRVIEPLHLLKDPQPFRDQRLERQLRLLGRALA